MYKFSDCFYHPHLDQDICIDVEYDIQMEQGFNVCTNQETKEFYPVPRVRTVTDTDTKEVYDVDGLPQTFYDMLMSECVTDFEKNHQL